MQGGTKHPSEKIMFTLKLTELVRICCMNDELKKEGICVWYQSGNVQMLVRWMWVWHMLR